MNLSRVSTQQLKQAVTTAMQHIQQAHEALAPVLVLLTEEERATTARAPSGLPPVARRLAGVANEYPALLAASEYDPEAVVEDVDNAEVVAALELPLSRLLQMVADSKLLWLAEAYMQTALLYGIAKLRARDDARIEQDIAPVANMFAARARRRRSK